MKSKKQVTGIALQLVSMLVFCYLGTRFFVKALRDPNYLSVFSGEKERKGIRVFAWGIVWGSGWICLRCVYRTVELSQGWTGYLIS